MVKPMPHKIHAKVTASVTELKKDPMRTVAAAKGGAVAILNRSEPAFYCVPAAEYEAMMEVLTEALENAELNAVAEARTGQRKVPVSLDDL
jgi:antitoxin StbD